VKVADPDQDAAAIKAVVEPWLYVDEYRARYLLPGVACGPYGFEGIVKADPAKVPAGTSAREIRAHLLNQAEDALDALGPAGWQFTTYPAMEFSGDVEYATATLDRKLIEPAKQRGISLKLRFEVTDVQPQ
jgi:hypothetical protein